MAAPKRPERADDDAPVLTRGGATIQERIAAFVMLDGMKDRTQAEKTLRLSVAGFTNSEIAVMLQTTPQVVATNLYTERKKANKKAAPGKGAEPAHNEEA